jgi:hypothetical protein
MCLQMLLKHLTLVMLTLNRFYEFFTDSNCAVDIWIAIFIGTFDILNIMQIEKIFKK